VSEVSLCKIIVKKGQFTVIPVDRRTRLKAATLENQDSICDACDDFPFIHPVRSSLLLLSLRINGMGHDLTTGRLVVPAVPQPGPESGAKRLKYRLVNIHINAFRLIL
jgi:hypothetical protein